MIRYEDRRMIRKEKALGPEALLLRPAPEIEARDHVLTIFILVRVKKLTWLAMTSTCFVEERLLTSRVEL